MEKLDLKKQLTTYYAASAKTVVEVDVPLLNFLMIDGQGNPNTASSYQEAVEALYSASYALKFHIKKTQQMDYGVMPLEGLWWADDMSAFTADNKSDWRWTMMIMQPKFIGDDLIKRSIDEVKSKKNLPALDKLRIEKFHEGRAAQVLHVGPFAKEGATIKRLHEFIDTLSHKTGKHHEIYLSDIRRAKPENWKTILRQPMG